MSIFDNGHLEAVYGGQTGRIQSSFRSLNSHGGYCSDRGCLVGVAFSLARLLLWHPKSKTSLACLPPEKPYLSLSL